MISNLELLRTLQTTSVNRAWKAIFDHAWDVCSQPIESKKAVQEVTGRDLTLASVDLFLASGGWELWTEFENTVESTAEALVAWWHEQLGGKAILILDALSLREIPWILSEANRRGYDVQTKVTRSELPADTTSFAKALGFGQRSTLENNQASSTHRLQGAKTESVDLPWGDCINLIGSEPNWVFWHHWIDSRVHDLAGAGKGLKDLTKEAQQQLTSEDFWAFIEGLTTGRKLVITSDHGYAASGEFSDMSGEQAQQLKSCFGSRRWQKGTSQMDCWIPPLSLSLTSQHGENAYVLGRRKWKSQGGYPTLIHGGLSLFEVACPFIKIQKNIN